MLQGLVTLVLGGAITLGVGSGAAFINDLTAAEKAQVISAKEKAVVVLTSAEKEYITSLEGESMRDLSAEDKAKLRAIKDKLHTETINNIDNPELKAEMEAHHNERVANRGTGHGNGNGQGRGQHRNI